MPNSREKHGRDFSLKTNSTLIPFFILEEGSHAVSECVTNVIKRYFSVVGVSLFLHVSAS